ncbi:MAG: ModE family transcriptional regulator [Betaproteobacteria bacterium HGW-Betaproteobacteria-22]|nr:MAG: ModE family transcriptional regulator [Betaproteobacteria bacterium HGW-Betaproteobacteria-22]
MRPVKIKIQFPMDGDIAMGPGKAQLLAAIHQHGSISAAAKSMHMSYKRAWDLVSVMNAGFKCPLVMTSVGGSHGGGAIVTEFGFKVLQHYQALQIKTEVFVLSESADLRELLVNKSESDPVS